MNENGFEGGGDTYPGLSGDWEGDWDWDWDWGGYIDNLDLSGYEICEAAPEGEEAGAGDLLLAGDTGAKEIETDNSPEAAKDKEAFQKVTGYRRYNGHFLEAVNCTEFCDAVARIAQRGFCYKHGQGLMRYEAHNGVWVEDIKESRLLDFIFNAAEKYRETWGYKEELQNRPSMRKLCQSLENPTFIRTGIKPAVMDMLTQSAVIFDADPYSINCGGIAVNLRTGHQRRAVQGDYFSKSTLFKPCDSEDAPIFRKFLLEVCGGDESKAAWVLRWFCRAAIGKTLDSYVLNLEGGGGNGKSVMANLFKRLFGGYGVVLPQELAIKGEGGGETARYMQGLEGARYGVLPDCGRGSLRISAIKRISGGDEVQARALHQERITFTPCISIVICSNVPLFLNETGEAMIRRWKTVRFEWTGKPDRLLLDRLVKEEGAAITGLIIREAGCYLADIAVGGDGFPPCEAIDAWAKAYIEERDPVKQFLEEHQEMFKTPVLCKTAWATYQRESEDYGDKYPQLHIFKEGMRAAGFVEKRLNPQKRQHWVFFKA